jgi:NADPH:quinone reductase-like Zn-dependent oxidoreductase
MRAARMHGYREPLRIEEIPVPDIGPDEVLVKVAAAGMCRSDFQLVDGYFQEGLPVSFPSHRDMKYRAPSPPWEPMCRDRRVCRRAY